MSACSRLVTRNGITALTTASTASPCDAHLRAGLAFPFGVYSFVTLPPHRCWQRRTIRSSVETTVMAAAQRGYRWFLLVRWIMKDPSPSRIPASHAASVGSISIPRFYGSAGRESLA